MRRNFLRMCTGAAARDGSQISKPSSDPQRDPTENLRVQSHVLGASLLMPRQMIGQAKSLEHFYSSLFGSDTLFDFSASLWPHNYFSRMSERPLWVPRVAQTEVQIQQGGLKQFFHNFGEPECIVGINCQKDHTSLIVSSESQSHETMPFLVTPVERMAPLFQSPSHAPFKSQPRECGVVNWLDLCVQEEEERIFALHVASMFGWHMSVPYHIAENKCYITCFNGSGGLENRHKLAGILPHSVILGAIEPPLKRGIPLVFFSCKSEAMLHRRIENAKSQGGKLIFGPLPADGQMAIVQDPQGTPFGLYYRTDEWNEVKPGTECTWELLTCPSVPFPGAKKE